MITFQPLICAVRTVAVLGVGRNAFRNNHSKLITAHSWEPRGLRRLLRACRKRQCGRLFTFEEQTAIVASQAHFAHKFAVKWVELQLSQIKDLKADGVCWILLAFGEERSLPRSGILRVPPRYARASVSVPECDSRSDGTSSQERCSKAQMRTLHCHHITTLRAQIAKSTTQSEP